MLTHWSRDKFAVISKTILSNALSWMNMYKFRLRFHWSLFPTVQLTLSELMMVSLLTHICVTRLNVIVLQRVAIVDHFCEARRASHCHSPQTTYSSKSTCCALSAQKPPMHVVVYADRRTTQYSIVDIIDWSWSYWQIWCPSWHVECFWAALSLHTDFRLLHIPLFCHNIHGGK